MSIAVISDVHANLAALEAVLGQIDATPQVEAVWCLGDLVGRGPRPQECAVLVRRRCSLVLAGNHDRVVCGLDPVWYLGDHSAMARYANQVMDQETLAWLRDRPSALVRPGVTLCHGGPADPGWQFVADRPAAASALAAVRTPLLLVGHTHQAAMFRLREGVLKDTPVRRPLEVRLGGCRAVLNPGAVGVATWGSPEASWMLLDREEGRCRWLRTPYDHQRTARELAEVGFPSLAAGLLR